jgi:hypothetical protein
MCLNEAKSRISMKDKNIVNAKNETNGYDRSRRSLFNQDNHDLVPIVS